MLFQAQAQDVSSRESSRSRRRESRSTELRVAVLVVDDDRDTRDAVQEILTMEGYASVVAETGEEALELLRDGLRPAIALVDLMMPGMDGWALIPAIRALHIDPIAIVSMTAGGRLDEAPESTVYMQKPLEWDVLFALVERCYGPPP